MCFNKKYRTCNHRRLLTLGISQLPAKQLENAMHSWYWGKLRVSHLQRTKSVRALSIGCEFPSFFQSQIVWGAKIPPLTLNRTLGRDCILNWDMQKWGHVRCPSSIQRVWIGTDLFRFDVKFQFMTIRTRLHSHQQPPGLYFLLPGQVCKPQPIQRHVEIWNHWSLRFLESLKSLERRARSDRTIFSPMRGPATSQHHITQSQHIKSHEITWNHINDIQAWDEIQFQRSYWYAGPRPSTDFHFFQTFKSQKRTGAEMWTASWGAPDPHEWRSYKDEKLHSSTSVVAQLS